MRSLLGAFLALAFSVGAASAQPMPSPEVGTLTEDSAPILKWCAGGFVQGNGASLPATCIPVPIAQNNAGLSAIATTGTPYVLRVGYAVAGDAPPMLYSPSAACGLNGGVGDGALQVRSADSNCWIATIPRDGIDIRQYGGKCDGSAFDNGVVINTAIASAVSLGVPSKIALPPGVCKFQTPLSLTGALYFTLAGAGRDSTELLYSGASTTVDLITNSATVRGITFQDFRLWSSTAMTAGTALHPVMCQQCAIKNVDVDRYNLGTNNFWNAVWIDQPDMFRIDGFNFQAQNDALAISGHGVGTGFQYDVFAVNGKLSLSAIGFHVAGGMDNVHGDNLEIASNNYNVVDDDALAAFKNQEIYMGPGVVTDQATTENYYINDPLCNLGNYGIVSISGPVTGAKAGANIDVKSFPNCQLAINSPLITNASGDGIKIQDISSVLMISPATIISANAGYGISATSAFTHLYSTGQVYANATNQLNANVDITRVGGGPAQPAVASGFGSGPSVSQANGPRTFVVGVGTGGVATSGVLTMPPATNGWSCTSVDGSTFSSGNTPTSVTLSRVAGGAWPSAYAAVMQCAPR